MPFEHAVSLSGASLREDIRLACVTEPNTYDHNPGKNEKVMMMMMMVILMIIFRLQLSQWCFPKTVFGFSLWLNASLCYGFGQSFGPSMCYGVTP